MANNEAGNIENREELSEPDDFELEPMPLCPNCLSPVDPHVYFCPHCNSNDAVNPMATYLPLVDLRFMYGTVGKLWHAIVYGKMNRIRRTMLALLMVLTLPATLPFLIVPTLYYGGIAGRPIRWRAVWLALMTAVIAGLAYLAIAHELPWHMGR